MEVLIMRTKKIAILGSFLLIMVVFAVGNVYAQELPSTEWPINGTVIRAGMFNGQAVIAIKDTSLNDWSAPPVSGEENEQLATALTAIAAGLPIVGIYDSINAIWLDMVIATE
jgi:hypothetical protein